MEQKVVLLHLVCPKKVSSTFRLETKGLYMRSWLNKLEVHSRLRLELKTELGCNTIILNIHLNRKFQKI
jgi:hypothetical protein